MLDGAIENEFGDPDEAADRKFFDELFLEQMEEWRKQIAEDVVENNPGVDETDLNYIVHRILNRIIFLRIAEDRDLERYEQLKELDAYSYESLEELFDEADERYNSNLFDLISDYSSDNIEITPDTIGSVLEELYYPKSPYTFAVVESDIIGRIYDLFLGNELQIRDGDLHIGEKPEVLNSQGAVATPDPIVSEIVDETLGEKIDGQAPADLDNFSVADICCGSGVFLTKALDWLTEYYRQWYVENRPDSDKLVELGDEQRLSYEEQRKIITRHIRGVDIDPLAVEVTRFNLVLRLLEEPKPLIQRFERTNHQPLVQDLSEVVKQGNSLVSTDYYTTVGDLSDPAHEVSPFNFNEEFEGVTSNGGFDAIVGNPPYIRIQKMREYTPETELEYYSDVYKYRTASENNYDKYCLFIERALDLTTEDGEVGYIVSQKFMTIKVGETLRGLISDNNSLRRLVHFGVEQVFDNHSTYTCLLFLSSGEVDSYTVEKEFEYKQWIRGSHIPAILTGEADDLSSEPWSFVEDAVDELFGKIRNSCDYRLNDVADVFVGLQTSRNSAYFLKEDEVDYEDGKYKFTDYKGNDQEVEEGLIREHLHTTNKWNPSIRPLESIEPNRLLIYPYEDGELIPPDELARRFPCAWEYFTTEEVKEDLKSRDLYETDVSGDFYRYGRKQGFGRIEDNKIVVQVLSLEPRYGLDLNGIANTAGGNDPFYNIRGKPELPEDEDHVVDLDLRYLMAVLSHPVIEAMVRSQSTFFRDGYYSHGGQYIEHVPVMAIDESNEREMSLYNEIVEDVQTHINLAEGRRELSDPNRIENVEDQMSILRDEIQRKVSSLYNLSQEEIRVAESV